MSRRIETEHLVLREFVPEDAPALIEVCKQDHIEHWLPDYREYHIHAAPWIDWVRRNYEVDDPAREFISLAIEHRETGKFIGQIAIGKGDYGLGLGYFMSNEFTGRGLMTEAVKAFAEDVFRRYRYDEVVATVQPGNIASWRVVEKLGFVYHETVTYLENGHDEEKPFKLYKLRNPAQRSAVAEEWDADSDAYFAKFGTAYDEVEADPAGKGFPAAVWPLVRACCPDLRGKRVLVPSSGDNVAVCAFWKLGAKVLAADLSERQIENARKVAAERGWDVKQFVSDTMTLSGVPDGEFDLAYTSNGVHVWISDLPAMYRNLYRTLKPGGHFVMFDTHPIHRPFNDIWKDGEIRIVKPYEDVGPFGTEYAWRTMDIVNALLGAGFVLERMEEFHSVPGDLLNHNYILEPGDVGEDKFDWRKNPYAALPQCLALKARKPE